jgi:parallel beta-helix repeat protein
MGIMVSDYAQSCIIDSNIITGCDENGIHHNGKGNNTISNNRIQNNSGSGITITAMFNGSVLISGDTIFQNGDDGIRLLQSGVTIQGNIIKGNNLMGVRVNPGLTNININKKNQITENGIYGIEIDQGSSVNVDDNLIQGHPDIGIRIAENGSGNITNNNISENQATGLENSGSAVISGNTIRKNHSHGIENLATASKTWIENNRISSNLESGVSLWETAELRGNVIDSNGVMGVTITGNIDTVFITENNLVSSNAVHGILVFAGSLVVIRDNQITDNGDPDDSYLDASGIFTEAPAFIEGNTIKNNESHGILVTPGSTNSIIGKNNIINGNAIGILMLGPATVDSNTIENNKNVGILIRSSNSKITRNEISGNRQGIALEEQASNIMISHCDISNNDFGIVSSGTAKVRSTTIKFNNTVGVDILRAGIDLGRHEYGESGYNIIGQNQVCNISNTTADTIYARYNYWDISDTTEIDITICDDDEDQQLGPVIFSPFLTVIPTGTEQWLTKNSDTDIIEMEVAYPNPFTDEINIIYHVAKPLSVTSRVVDLHGRVVVTIFKDRHHVPGQYIVRWNGKTENDFQAPAGVYFILMEGDGFVYNVIVQMVE